MVVFVTAPALSSEAVPDAPIAIRLDNQGNQFRNDRLRLLVKLRDRAGLEELSSSSMASMASRKGKINNWVNFRSVNILCFKVHVSFLLLTYTLGKLQFHVKKGDKYNEIINKNFVKKFHTFRTGSIFQRHFSYLYQTTAD